MQGKEIIEGLEKDYSRSYALPWDNVGLLTGRDDKVVKKIYVAVDATDEVIEAACACKADMLITHHPLIFGGRMKITNEDFIGRRLLKLIREDISYYAMHTNYDVLGMASLSGKMLSLRDTEVLEITEEEEGIGRIGNFPKEMTLEACCEQVKKAFRLEYVKVFGELSRRVRRVAICPGSGKSVIGVSIEKGADVLVTGDIGHHEGIDAAAQGLSIIDAGHYGVEHIFIEDMKQYLIQHFQEMEVIGAPISHPFIIL